jgi:hypothetical protein
VTQQCRPVEVYPKSSFDVRRVEVREPPRRTVYTGIVDELALDTGGTMTDTFLVDEEVVAAGLLDDRPNGCLDFPFVRDVEF